MSMADAVGIWNDELEDQYLAAEYVIMRREKWDHRYMEIAHTVAKWSKDPSTQVGAILVAPGGRQIFWGYNGFPAGVLDAPDLLADREQKYPRVIHAEANALLMSNTDLSDWVCYCTLMPCSNCTAMLIQKGITRVVVPKLTGKHDHWQESFRVARHMADQVGMKIEELTHVI